MRTPVIRKNDIVILRQGKDKGKTGKVLRVYPETRRALVEHVHTVKEFIKQDRSKNVQGGIMEKEAPVPLSRLIDHIDHAVKIAGVDHVGFGSDFDGINATPVGLDDVSKLPAITEALRARGLSDKDIRKILGGNLLRLVEKVMR
jgi:ribosomal protein L24